MRSLAKLNRIISISASTGWWHRYYQNADGTGPFEFERVAFWLSGEFEWEDGFIHQRVVGVGINDVEHANTAEELSGIWPEIMNRENFHDSDFSMLGEVLKSDPRAQ